MHATTITIDKTNPDCPIFTVGIDLCDAAGTTGTVRLEWRRDERWPRLAGTALADCFSADLLKVGVRPSDLLSVTRAAIMKGARA